MDSCAIETAQSFRSTLRTPEPTVPYLQASTRLAQSRDITWTRASCCTASCAINMAQSPRSMLALDSPFLQASTRVVRSRDLMRTRALCHTDSCAIETAQSLPSTRTLRTFTASVRQASTRVVRSRVPSLLWADHTAYCRTALCAPPTEPSLSSTRIPPSPAPIHKASIRAARSQDTSSLQTSGSTVLCALQTEPSLRST